MCLWEQKKNNLESKEEDHEKNEGILSTEEKVDLVQNQLDILNTKLLNLDKKPWWKTNIPLLISLMALMASIGFSYYGVKRDQAKDLQSSTKEKAIAKSIKVEEINQLVLKLTELQEKNIKLVAENPNVDVNSLSVLSNYQRLIYVNKILYLLDSLDGNFPPEVYALIANELKNDGQFVKARNLYFEELANAKTSLSRMVAYRDLASIFGVYETCFQNTDSSRFLWRKSIFISDSITGEQKYNYKGYGYQLWAGNEFYFGNTKFALELIDSAKQTYSKLPNSNTAKDFNLRRLNQMVEFYSGGNIESQLYRLSGEWTTRGEFEAKVHFGQNMNMVMCSLESYEFGMPSYNLTGPFISMAGNYMTFNLQGAKKFYQGTVVASVKLYPDPNNKKIIYVSFNELNMKEKKFTIFKR